MSNFFQQLKALIWRNILLKRRNRLQLYQELLSPIFFILVLGSIKVSFPPTTESSRTFNPININSVNFTSAFSNYSLIYCTPNTTKYRQFMEDVVHVLDGPPTFRMFDSESDLDAAYEVDYEKNPNITFTITFDYDGDPNAYAIRTSTGVLPSSSSSYYPYRATCRAKGDVSNSSKGCEVNKYMTTGFVSLQVAIDNAMLADLGVPNATIEARNTSIQLMDLGKFIPDINYLATVSAIYFVLSFCFFANYLVVNIVSEKETKIKDGMLMMGLNPTAFWLSWSIVYLAMVIFSAGLMVMILSLTNFFEKSNMFLMFIMIVLYGTSFIALGFMITPFFSKARVAGAVASFSTIIVSLLYIAVSETRDEFSYDSSIPAWAQWLMSLLSPLAFAACIDQALFLDVHAGGFNFDSSLTYGKFPLYAPMLMLLVDTILYALLTVYFDKVIPGEYGVRHKPYFFLLPSYWFPSMKHDESQPLVMNTRNEGPLVDIERVPADFERRVAMKISSLSKSFEVDGKTTKAVRDFSLDIYEGQITCLLGHNGAGKTTLMNILTGVLPPTSGSASIMGLNITTPADMELIRKKCGICPQHNILYEKLSCKEHLMMFADIKGVPSHLKEATVRQSLKDVDLENQEHTFSKDLSGGQKRKLCVAIALIGDPKLIFLDEPTAGMDPFSRRHLWSLLKKRKEGRVVLLTTHFMEEADILSDRKAFIRKGKLRCCGSSLFLKSKFGVGYHITMVVEPTCDVANLTDFLQSVIPKVNHERTHGKEIGYTVPLSDVSKFPLLFGKLDEKTEKLGVKSYGVSMTTLEEVFLKLEDIDKDEQEDDDDESAGLIGGHTHHKTPHTNGDVDDQDLTAMFTKNLITDKWQLAKQQYWALLWLRFLSLRRNIKAVIFQVVVPIILVSLGMVLVKTNSTGSASATAPPPFNMSLKYYANDSVPPRSLYTPGLLVFDAWNQSASKALISDWATEYQIDSYPPKTKTYDVRSHFLGFEMNGMIGNVLTDAVVLYNSTALHSIPVAMSWLTQSMLNASGINDVIRTTSYPRQPHDSQKDDVNSQIMFGGMVIGLAFVLIIPGFSVEIVRDREAKVRSQLRISGVGFSVYWGSIYTMNMLVYLIPTLIIIIIALAVQIKGLSSAGAMGTLLLLFLVNIPFLCFFAMILSFIFDKADSCSSYLPMLLNLASIVPYLVVAVIDMLGNHDVSIPVHYALCVFDPPYVVLGGFYFIVRVYQNAVIDGRTVQDSDYFELDNHTLIAIIMPVLHMMWMYWLLKLLDTLKTGGTFREACGCCSNADKSPKPNQDMIKNEDSDVKEERSRIDAMEHHVTEHSNTSPVPMTRMDQEEPVAYSRQLRKTFAKRTENVSRCSKLTSCRASDETRKVAVRNLSFGVDPGEILGLLGPNGAGKTTALNMIIADTEPTCGQVIVRGVDIRSNLLNSSCLGYCPQHDALWATITMREHLTCFAAIKGVPSEETDRIVNFYVSKMKLEQHKNKQSKNLSGGTKRKLSYIMSILGNPDFVLLDEPSTGMDPQSKRFLWDTISATFRNTNKGAILTTHYMEEADALCSRVGILVNGQLQCLGSTQHLKNKFGSGYILEVKLAISESYRVELAMDKLEEHLRQLFPGMKMVERFMERAQYAIPKENVSSLGDTFANLEECKDTYNLEEYCFSQSSLEQVFLHFAKKQKDEQTDHVPDVQGEDNPSYNV